jgi:hypothetical protein
MKYLPLMIMALLIMGLIAGCTSNTTPADTAGKESTDTATVAAEAGNVVESVIIADTEEVEIGEMI